MEVKIVTDSCSDISPAVAKEFGITVVPVYVRFGSEVYRDQVDIDSEEFFRKLATSPIHPSTSAPSPGDFAETYKKLAQETDKIVSIHVTSKHSATYDAALAGKEALPEKRCQIEVIDSKGVTMWQGLVAISAAKAAEARKSLREVVERTHETINQMRALGLLDTLMYAVKGGRLGKAISAVESVLNVKPLLTLRDGEVHPAGLVRSRSKGIERLYEFVKSAVGIEDLSIVHSTTQGEAETLAERLSSFLPKISPRIARLGPALGAHGGPGALVVAFQEAPAVAGGTELNKV